MSKAFIDLKEVVRRSGLSKTVIYDRMATGTFPRACKIGVSARWVDAEVDAWIEEQIAARDAFTEAWLSAKTARASQTRPERRRKVDP
jgi:prophage regulatory protein